MAFVGNPADLYGGLSTHSSSNVTDKTFCKEARQHPIDTYRSETWLENGPKSQQEVSFKKVFFLFFLFFLGGGGGGGGVKSNKFRKGLKG